MKQQKPFKKDVIEDIKKIVDLNEYEGKRLFQVDVDDLILFKKILGRKK